MTDIWFYESNVCHFYARLWQNDIFKMNKTGMKNIHYNFADRIKRCIFAPEKETKRPGRARGGNARSQLKRTGSRLLLTKNSEPEGWIGAIREKPEGSVLIKRYQD